MTWGPSWAYVLSSCFFEYSAWKNNCQTGFFCVLLDGNDFFFQCSLRRFDGVCMSSWDWIYKIHKVYCQMNIPQRFNRNITRNLSKSNWDYWTPILFERNLFKTFLVWIYPNEMSHLKEESFRNPMRPISQNLHISSSRLRSIMDYVDSYIFARSLSFSGITCFCDKKLH